MNFEQIPQTTIEEQANSPENATELLFGRLSNSIIKKQIIDLLYQAELWAGENVTYNEPIEDENGVWQKDTSENLIFHKTPHISRAREEIEDDYDKTLERVKSFTDIDFGSEQAHGGSVDSNEKIFLGWKWPTTGEKPTAKQWAIIEAHEKGHSMRPYSGPSQKFSVSIGEKSTSFFQEYFSPAFDLSAVSFSEEDFQIALKIMEQDGVKYEETPTFEEQKEEFFSYLFSGVETAERMSQLKNYFGFKGDEIFTLEHLKYAKEHYIIDTGFDNRMTPFLQAITPQTEGEFIRLINCSGI
jgi:hypothetical protein